MSALEIKQDVEGYSQMNDEAFARRFYADRAELESLGIHLKVDKPAEGYYEAENYSLPPENFYLPAIEFTDEQLGALRMALHLLDGEFAYAEPLRLALQQLTWGKPNPLEAPEERSVTLAVTPGAGGRDVSQRLSKIETAIFRRKTIVFDYYTIGRDSTETRKVDPYHLLYKGGAVLPDRPLPRARRRARVPRLARPRQGRLLLQGRARLQPPRGLRPARVRHPHRLAARRAGRARAHLALGPHRLARPAPLRARRRGHRGRRRGDLRDRLRERAPDGVLGTGPRRARPHRGPAGAGHRSACPARADHRSPHRSAGAGGAGRARRRGGRGRRRPRGLADPPRALRPARDAGRHPDRRRPRGPQARARRALRAAAGVRAGAAPGHRRAERRQLRRRLVRALRRDHRATRSRSTQSPTATTSPARRGSSRSRPRRSWPPST